jgi:hypothetical protein
MSTKWQTIGSWRTNRPVQRVRVVRGSPARAHDPTEVYRILTPARARIFKHRAARNGWCLLLSSESLLLTLHFFCLEGGNGYRGACSTVSVCTPRTRNSRLRGQRLQLLLRHRSAALYGRLAPVDKLPPKWTWVPFVGWKVCHQAF